ncbi:MAG: PAS domain S-box protein [Proteobacteria bacterium]|nr:PAS domain S-box protein [Burkholderiales bacterium]
MTFPVSAYGYAGLGLLVAIAARFALDPVLGDALPLVTLYAAVAFAVWRAGWRAAVAVMITGYLICVVVFFEPRGRLGVFSLPLVFGMLAYLVSASVMIVLGHLMHRGRARAEAAEGEVRDQAELLRVTLASIGDAVITTDNDRRITAMNEIARTLTGWTPAHARGQRLEHVFRISNEDTGEVVDNPVQKVFEHGRIVGLANHTVLTDRDGVEHPIDDSAAPIRDDQGRIRGAVLVFHDVSERRRVERELALNVQRFELAVDAVNGIIYDYDFRTGHAERTRGLKAVLGYAPEAVPRTAQWWFEQIHPEDYAAHRAQIDAATAAGECLILTHYRVRHQDGRWLHVEDRAILVRDGQGASLRMVGCTVDISDRVHAEETRRISESRFTAMFEASSAGMAELDIDEGRLLRVNRALGDMLGCDVAEMAMRPFSDFMQIDERETYRAQYRQLTDGALPTHQTEKRLMRGDGATRWVQVTVNAIRDSAGKPVRSFAIVQDIDRRKQVELALDVKKDELAAEVAGLARLHELTQRLVSATSIPEALHEVLAAALLLMATNKGCVQIYDAAADRLELVAHAGMPEQFGLQYGSVQRDGVSACSRAMSTERVVIADTYADPRTAAVRERLDALDYRAAQATPLLGRDGMLLGMLSTYYPTPHEPSARSLQMLDLCARQAADLIERLRIVDALREADRRKDEFLAILAHELRNPLAPIANGLALLERSLPDPHATPAVVSMMGRQLAHVVRLIDDLLDVRRITENKLELRIAEVDLSEILRGAEDTTRAHFDAARHSLTVRLPPQRIWVQGDAVRLTQVFSNLLNNAARYTPPGGAIEVNVDLDDTSVTIRVADNGVGIPPAMLGRIFDLFAQIGTADDFSKGGLGIGLTLVRRLVEMHGGTVSAQSDGEGRGSVFTVRLTRVHGEAAPGDASLAGVRTVLKPPRRKAAKRVLIVDDNVEAAETLAILLDLEGHEAHAAHDGLKALEVAAKVEPDVVLLDLGLPGLDGYQVCHALRKRTPATQPMIVAVTGWGQDSDRRRTQEAGFDGHLVKPVDPATILELLAGA